ncbi:MAG: transposase, partial [Clostridiales bacterium]|nr:transposase [Clostridiales bacterium]
MELIVFEQDKCYVRRNLENGEIDYLEVVSEGAETEFFQYIAGRGILRHLAESYPLRRRKREVPLWLYIASDLSLRLHGMQSFHGYPFVVRTGGMLNAFGPEVGKKVVHPQTGQVTIHCPGFNRKNRYDRQTPCDQDWLRKTARATAWEKLLDWYNREIPRLLGKEKLFDSEGIFIGDASYVFVPDNPHYEGSVVMLFDEHNHPVDEKKLTPAQLRRCRLRRCYKWVELMHTNSSGDFFFFVAMHLGSGKANECPILYELVENFLEVVGSGVMKWLIVDRGFLDGGRIGHLKKKWKVDTVSGLRSDMAVLEDARGLLRLGPGKWQEYHPPEKQPPEALPQPTDKQSRKRKEEQAPRVEKVIALNHLTSWESCPVELTVVLTEQEEAPPWGLVTTYPTRDAPFIRRMYHLRESIEERH